MTLPRSDLRDFAGNAHLNQNANHMVSAGVAVVFCLRHAQESHTSNDS